MSQWKTQVENNFSHARSAYDAFSDVQRRAAATLIELCPDINSPSILEIGCGTGSLTRLLIDKYPDADMTITDISAEMLAYARSAIDAPHVKWRVMDGEHPDLEQKYDLIIANMVFQWFEDREEALRKLSTYLKPEGQIFYAVPGPDSFKEWTSILNEMDLPSGLLTFEKPFALIKEERQVIDYKDTLDFLKSMKKIGAHKPNKNYISIGSKLRAACRKCDAEYSGKITWHIIYANA